MFEGMDHSIGDLPTGAGGSGSGPELAAGTVVSGRYRISGLIGRGGMAAVYRAEDQELGRTVALKFLLPRFQEQEESLRRFASEARIIATFQHRNIVTLHELERGESGLFLVMEHVSGGSLREHIGREGVLSVESAVSVFRGICQGVQYAHKKGVVHRDLKPANVLMDEEGVPKVSDFGLSKLYGSDVSQTGFGLGTVYYTAPEVFQDAKGADYRADIFSLGGLLYYLLKGETPAGALDFTGFPSNIQGVLTRCLKSNREDRFFSVAEVLSALEGVVVSVAAPREAGGCPFCGMVHPEDTRYCDETGEALYAKCFVCGKESRIPLKFCRYCGCNVEEEAEVRSHLGKPKGYISYMSEAEDFLKAGRYRSALSSIR